MKIKVIKANKSFRDKNDCEVQVGVVVDIDAKIGNWAAGIGLCTIVEHDAPPGTAPKMTMVAGEEVEPVKVKRPATIIPGAAAKPEATKQPQSNKAR